MAAADKPRDRIDAAHRWCYARPATVEELDRGERYLAAGCEELQQNSAPAEQPELLAWTSYARVLLSANEFLYVD